MSDAEVAVVRRWYELADDFAALTRDEQAIDRLRPEVEPLFSPEVKVSLIGPSFTQVRLEGSGIDGLRRAWGEWLKAFHSYRVEVEELIDLGDRVLALTLGHAQVDPGGPVIENRAATIWTVRDGRIAQIDSYLEREQAERDAHGRE